MRVEGFPLDLLSIDIESGEYYYDLEVKDVSTSGNGCTVTIGRSDLSVQKVRMMLVFILYSLTENRM